MICVSVLITISVFNCEWNVLVASVAWWRFWQAGHFDWFVFFAFAVASVPCAWLGSSIHISPQIYKLVLGAVLSLGGVILLLRARPIYV